MLETRVRLTANRSSSVRRTNSKYNLAAPFATVRLGSHKLDNIANNWQSF
jgi:hypothetical protein